MIRASSLRGRAVVDMDSAAKVGQVDDVVLDPDNRQVAGLMVAHGHGLLGDRHRVFLPAGAIHALGPDALMARSGGPLGAEPADIASLPRLAHVTGRRVVSEGGKLLGVIGDVLVSVADGQIIGYTLDSSSAVGKIEEFFGGGRDERSDYIRADTELRVGSDLVVVPDSAIVRGDRRPHPTVPGSEEVGAAMSTAQPANGRPTDAPGPAPRVHDAHPVSWRSRLAPTPRSAETPVDSPVGSSARPVRWANDPPTNTPPVAPNATAPVDRQTAGWTAAAPTRPLTTTDNRDVS